jgi:hypothetical protein
MLPDLAVRPAQVLTPDGAKLRTRGVSLGEPLFDRSVRAQLPRRQIAEPDTETARDVTRNRAAGANLDVVGMRSEYEQIDRAH